MTDITWPEPKGSHACAWLQRLSGLGASSPDCQDRLMSIEWPPLPEPEEEYSSQSWLWTESRWIRRNWVDRGATYVRALLHREAIDALRTQGWRMILPGASNRQFVLKGAHRFEILVEHWVGVLNDQKVETFWAGAWAYPLDPLEQLAQVKSC